MSPWLALFRLVLPLAAIWVVLSTPELLGGIVVLLAILGMAKSLDDFPSAAGQTRRQRRTKSISPTQFTHHRWN